ncbi:MAG: glycosidase [Candidatus Wallbacteria bacterium]|nr:glycosidase [Candidatus Wallbacteria bacterium]
MKLKVEFKKYEKNPVLTVNPGNDWESKAVFNAGLIYKNGKFHMLYRAIGEYEKYISRIGYALSDDGRNFRRMSDQPVLVPEYDYEQYGCEDPRITEIGSKLYVTYVAYNKTSQYGSHPQAALAETTDFYHFKKLGLISPFISINKDTVLFPEKINNQYVMLHRAHNWKKDGIRKTEGKFQVKLNQSWLDWDLDEIPDHFPEKTSIWIADSEDLTHWHHHRVLFEPEFAWENCKIGGGCPPVKTGFGWLIIYHGIESLPDGKLIYRAGLAVLDLHDPSKVIYRHPVPIISPEHSYETEGDVPQVVFPEGAALIDGMLYVYYGGGDKCINLATGTIKPE